MGTGVEIHDRAVHGGPQHLGCKETCTKAASVKQTMGLLAQPGQYRPAAEHCTPAAAALHTNCFNRAFCPSGSKPHTASQTAVMAASRSLLRAQLTVPSQAT